MARLSSFVLTFATFSSDDRWQCSTVLFSQTTSTPCNSLQLTATHCNSLQLTCKNSIMSSALRHHISLQHTATHCNTLQHTTTHYNALQVAPKGIKSIGFIPPQFTATLLQHTATHCNTLQHTCNNRHHVNRLYATATQWNTPQHTATHCD